MKKNSDNFFGHIAQPYLYAIFHAPLKYLETYSGYYYYYYYFTVRFLIHKIIFII